MLYALDVKTSYSMLSSLIKIEELTEKAKELGYFSLAITDTNNMFGAYEFYLSCKKNNIKPIIGIKLEYNENKFILCEMQILHYCSSSYLDTLKILKSSRDSFKSSL